MQSTKSIAKMTKQRRREQYGGETVSRIASRYRVDRQLQTAGKAIGTNEAPRELTRVHPRFMPRVITNDRRIDAPIHSCAGPRGANKVLFFFCATRDRASRDAQREFESAEYPRMPESCASSFHSRLNSNGTKMAIDDDGRDNFRRSRWPMTLTMINVKRRERNRRKCVAMSRTGESARGKSRGAR